MNRTTMLVIAGAAFASLASGGTTTFDNRADWAAAAVPVTTEDFESVSLGALPLPTALGSGLGIRFASGGVQSLIEAGDPRGLGLENTTENGRRYLAFGDHGDTGSYSVSFSTAGSTALGFFISGWQVNNDPGTGFSITLLNNGQIVDDFFQDSDADVGDVTFFGVVSDSVFNEFRMHIGVLVGGGSDFVAFDDVAWNIPAPGASAPLALGALALSRRRRD
jgi:hypothetical protein